MSHPTWVCGLKLKNVEYSKNKALSHPTWVCGLKRPRSHRFCLILKSHPTWVCGLKQLKKKIILLNSSHTLRGCVD